MVPTIVYEAWIIIIPNLKMKWLDEKEVKKFPHIYPLYLN